MLFSGLARAAPNTVGVRRSHPVGRRWLYALRASPVFSDNTSSAVIVLLHPVGFVLGLMSFNSTAGLDCLGCLDAFVFMSVILCFVVFWPGRGRLRRRCDGRGSPSVSCLPDSSIRATHVDGVSAAPALSLRLDVIQLDGGFGLFRLFGWLRFHGSGSFFGLLFSRPRADDPKRVRLPPFTSRVLHPCQ